MSNKQTKFKQTEIGEIPEDWNLKTVNDVVESASTGLDAIKRAPIVLDNTGIKCLRIQDVSQEKNYSDWGYCKVTDNNYKKFHLYKGDILIARTGASVGVNKILNRDFDAVFNNGLIRIKVNSEVLPLFLFYNLQSLRFNQHIDSISQGTSTQPNIQIKSLLGFNITLPDISEQQEIVDILASLNDKMRLNKKMNKTLEKIGKTLFKHWFVDFEFPNENGKPYKSCGGKMVDSELGKIPEGWEVKQLSDVSNISIGRTPPRLQSEWFSTNPQDVKWISIKDMAGNDVYIHKTAEYLTNNAVSKFRIPKIPKNTVIVSFKLTVGRVSITTEEMLSNEAIAHIKISNKNLTPEFIYLYLKSFDYSSLGTTSSIATAVNSKSIRSIPLIVPEEQLLKKFTNTTSPLFEQIFKNTIEINQLSIIRDFLLPRLMNGKLRV